MFISDLFVCGREKGGFYAKFHHFRCIALGLGTSVYGLFGLNCFLAVFHEHFSVIFSY